LEWLIREPAKQRSRLKKALPGETWPSSSTTKPAHGPHRHAVLQIQMTGLDKSGGSATHHPLFSIFSQVPLTVVFRDFVDGAETVAGCHHLSQHVLVDVGCYDLAFPGLSLGKDVLKDHRQ